MKAGLYHFFSSRDFSFKSFFISLAPAGDKFLFIWFLFAVFISLKHGKLRKNSRFILEKNRFTIGRHFLEKLKLCFFADIVNMKLIKSILLYCTVLTVPIVVFVARSLNRTIMYSAVVYQYLHIAKISLWKRKF